MNKQNIPQKNIRKKQIKLLFNNYIVALEDGIWFSGITHYGKYQSIWGKNQQIWEYYYKNKNGRLDGEYKIWWGNGQLKIHTYFTNGNINGEYKEWEPNGQLIIHAFLIMNRYDGEYKSWADNGDLILHLKFKNNKLIDVIYKNPKYKNKWYYWDWVQSKEMKV